MSAQDYLNQIPGMANSYYGPFSRASLTEHNDLLNQLHSLLSDPSALIGRIGSKYTQSPGYQNQLNQSLQAANQAASAGGMLGTPAAQYESANIADQAANKDYGDYLSRALGLYSGGLQGLGNLEQSDLNERNMLADDRIRNLLNQANYEQAKEQSKSNLFGDIIGSGLGALGMGGFGKSGGQSLGGYLLSLL